MVFTTKIKKEHLARNRKLNSIIKQLTKEIVPENTKNYIIFKF
jgi:hypothetical protein